MSGAFKSAQAAFERMILDCLRYNLQCGAVAPLKRCVLNCEQAHHPSNMPALLSSKQAIGKADKMTLFKMNA